MRTWSRKLSCLLLWIICILLQEWELGLANSTQVMAKLYYTLSSINLISGELWILANFRTPYHVHCVK